MAEKSPKEVIVGWLSQRAGIAKEVALALPDATVAKIAANPRQEIGVLFATLHRNVPKEHRLRELEAMLRSTSQQVSDVVEARAQGTHREAVTAAGSMAASTERVEAPSNTERINAMKQTVEQCFAHFYGQIVSGLNQRTAHGQHDPTFNTALKNPFHIIDANKQNRYANAETARQEAQSRGIHLLYVANEKLRDPRHFVYDIERGEAAAMQGFAGFAPVERRLVLPQNFDPRNALHFLVAYHETVHIMHTAHWIMSGGRGFVEFYTRERPAVVLNEEFDAYALEIEALNLLLQEELRNVISAGGTPDGDAIAARLGISQQERPPLNLILNLAKKYYPSGTVTSAQKPPQFMGQIAANQAAYGYDLFLRDGDQIRQVQ